MNYLSKFGKELESWEYEINILKAVFEIAVVGYFLRVCDLKNREEMKRNVNSNYVTLDQKVVTISKIME
mgnify:CR=1 FL=1